MRVHEASLAKNDDPVTAISDAMRAVLMSPRFFMRIEETKLDSDEDYSVRDLTWQFD